jgi:alpha-amylase
MTVAARAVLAAVALLTAAAPAADARTTRTFAVQSLSAQQSVKPGSAFRVRVRVVKLHGRHARRGRLTFSLRRSKPARSSLRLPAKASRVRLSKPGASKRFVLRLRVPRDAPTGRYYLRACVRRSSGTETAACRSRLLRVARRKPGVPPHPSPGPGPGGDSGGPPPGGPEALQSLRPPLTGENYYFVMADRFENGSTANDLGGLPADRLKSGFDPTHKGFYHGGDLKGLLQRVDYIKGLGTTAIWLTPSFKNKPVQGPPGQETAGYHGYWITDFTQIDPHLGTNQDLANLVKAAHDRGMKVFFDIITNHTADVITYEQKDGGPAPYAYVPKDDAAYRTAAGTPFDDRDYAGTTRFPELDPATSFPFVPHDPAGSDDPGDVNHKVPEWLNDVTLYHNRGDTTFLGENAQYGDFFGLDDLFTENPRVVAGMTDIYKRWITDFKIDGFRIDTMKHVNDEFWQQFAPAVLAHAHAQGKKEFLMFGEVFDTTKTYTSHFTTHDKVQAVLDFPFQAAAQRFAAASGPSSALRDFFVADDWYTDADSNVYQLPTFLGNHDMGRIGFFLRQANGGASDSEIFDRDRLAHELMYFSRGNPVIYYGDEQGFVGDGGDQDARQDMFPSRVASYNDDDLIATDATTAQSNFDTLHPLYEAIRRLAQVTRENPALRNGPQQSRYSTDGAGIYAFSRLDRASGREYVVALNNSEQEQTAFVPTAAGRAAAFRRVYGDAALAAATDAGRRLAVTVPPLSTVVYRSDGAIPRSPAAPEISVVPLPEGGQARDRAEVRAFVDGDSFYDVTFQAKVGDGEWTTIGTDDNEPYRVFHEVAGIAPGTTVRYRATVLDNAGHTRTSDVGQVQVGEPSITLTAPLQDGRVRDRAAVSAEVTPDDNDNVVRFERRADGGDWTTVGTDASQPVYSVSDDVSDLAPGTPLEYRAVLTYAPGRTVTSATRSAHVAEPVTTAVIHYKRTASDYGDWGLHLFGDALAPGEATAEWTNATPFEGSDSYGVFHAIQIADDTKQVGFIVHGKPPGGNPDTKDPAGSPDRFFIPIDHPEIWLKQGDPAILFSPDP